MRCLRSRLVGLLWLTVVSAACDRDPLSVTAPRPSAPLRNLTASEGLIVEATDINRAGQIAGYVWVGGQQRAAIQVDNQTYDLGTIDGSETSFNLATGINERGQVVGWGEAAGALYSFVWTPDVPNGTTGTMRRLPDPPSGPAHARDLNDAGQIAGTRPGTAEAPSILVLWSGDQVIELGGPGDIYASGINAYGQIAATCYDPTVGSQAVLWTPAEQNGMHGSFATLCPECGYSSAAAINDLGQVALAESRIWTPGSPNGVEGKIVIVDDGFGLAISITDINRRGDVVGWIEVPLSEWGYTTHAVLWRPTDPNGEVGRTIDLSPDLTYSVNVGSSAWLVGEEENDAVRVLGTTWDYDCWYSCGQWWTSWMLTDLSNPPLVANAGPPASGYEGEAVYFNGRVSSPSGTDITYEWDFGDGTVKAHGASPTHIYADDGYYTVTLTVHDAAGRTSTATTSASIYNRVPTATLAVTPTQVTEGQSFTLSLANPSDVPADLAELEFAFDCGDGPGLKPYGGSSSITCAVASGTSRVARGSVRDRDGGVSDYAAPVSVTNVAPTVENLRAPTTVRKRRPFTLEFTFTDAGAEDGPWSYSISWGDGTTTVPTGLTARGETVSVTHEYSKAGGGRTTRYTIEVSVRDRSGGEGLARRTIEVTQ